MGKSKILLAAIIGGAAGALAAVLLAPRSGKEIRQQLLDAADDQLDRLSQAAMDLKDAALERVDRMLARAEESLSEAEEEALENERS